MQVKKQAHMDSKFLTTAIIFIELFIGMIRKKPNQNQMKKKLSVSCQTKILPNLTSFILEIVGKENINSHTANSFN